METDLDDDEVTISCCEIVWVIDNVQLLSILHPGDAGWRLTSWGMTSHFNLGKEKTVIDILSTRCFFSFNLYLTSKLHTLTVWRNFKLFVEI